jgi:hypothetical protein
MNEPNRTQDGLAQPSAADYMSAIDKVRAYEGAQQALEMGNATLRAVASLRTTLHAFAKRLSRGTAPKRILAQTGVTYVD